MADLTPFGTMSLRALIEALARAPSDLDVNFEFGLLSPGELASYRGYYDHLALGWKESGIVTVGELLTRLRQAHGKRFEGYKGGTYTMSDDTPVWADQWGRASSTAIVDVVREGSFVYLRTARGDG